MFAGPGKDLVLASPNTNTDSLEKDLILPLQDADINAPEEDITIPPNALNRNSKTLLMHLAEEGDLRKINRLTEKGADVNKQDKSGNTAFTYAHRNYHKEVAHFLLEKMAPTNQSTELLLAIRDDNIDTVADLIERSDNKVDENCLIALEYAYAEGRLEIANVLFKKNVQ